RRRARGAIMSATFADVGAERRVGPVVLDVTAFNLDAGFSSSDFLVLSDDEKQRARRFRFERDRRRFVRGRAELRRRLAAELGAEAAEVPFEYGANGKPGVPGAPFTFNLSHSGDLAVLAIAYGDDVQLGVDVEVPRGGDQQLDELVARRYFAPGEIRRLFALSADARYAAFFRCWTRKEALLKALGGGLMLPLHDFEVTLEPAEPARIVAPSEPLARGNWEIADISAISPRSYAAVAAGTPVGAPVTINVNPGGGRQS
ncbi:MAG: 4'-phosphopantetheinyl transferase family protein, partial [Acidothermaceae bacterium]